MLCVSVPRDWWGYQRLLIAAPLSISPGNGIVIARNSGGKATIKHTGWYCCSCWRIHTDPSAEYIGNMNWTYTVSLLPMAIIITSACHMSSVCNMSYVINAWCVRIWEMHTANWVPELYILCSLNFFHLSLNYVCHLNYFKETYIYTIDNRVDNRYLI